MTAFSTEEWATALVMEKYTLARGVLNLVSCLNLHQKREEEFTAEVWFEDRQWSVMHSAFCYALSLTTI
jgi:hypothetical protein